MPPKSLAGDSAQGRTLCAIDGKGPFNELEGCPGPVAILIVKINMSGYDLATHQEHSTYSY